MRLAYAVSPFFAVLMLSALVADAQDRYGGSLPANASTDDFLKSLEGLAGDTPPGDYRSAAGGATPASSRPPNPAPSAAAPAKASGNTLRRSANTPAPQNPTSQLRSFDPPPQPRPSSSPPNGSRGRSADPYSSAPATGGRPGSTSAAPPQPGRSAATLSQPPLDDRRGYTQPARSQPVPPPADRSYASALDQRQSPSNLRSRFDDQSPIERSQPAIERSVTVDNTPGPRELRTQQMLEKMLRRHSGSQLTGAPLSLASVIASSPSRDEQSRRVEAYWALTSSVADYYLGLWEADELHKLRNEVSTFSQPLGEAQKKLATRIDTSLKAARSAQYQLARRMGTDVMPLPADTPFTGPYATRVESVFAGGAPTEAMLLRDLLPLRLAELQDAADDLAESEDWVERVRNDQVSRSTGEGVIRALKLNALTRRAFVQLARDYNLQINRYTQLAAPELVDTGRLVAMLIRTPSARLQAGEDAYIAGSDRGFSASADRRFESGTPARR